MTFTPYTKDAITRIRNGATARDLGWPDSFYARVCRDHGLAVVSHAPKTQAASTFSESDTAPEKPSPKQISLGDCFYDPVTRILRRGETTTTFRESHGRVFAALIKSSPNETLLNGKDVADLTGLNPATGAVAVAIRELRDRLEAFDLKIESLRGRGNGGYWISDTSTDEFVKVQTP
jgi:DNA-binding response OmpR family regulator